MKMEPSTSRRSSGRNSFSIRSSSSSSRPHIKDSKNPYSAIGIDKFSALLEELENKKRKIYSQVKNPDEISLVRFVYKDSDDYYVPIVVKMKKNNDKHHQQGNINIKQSPPRNEDSDRFPLESFDSAQVNKQVQQSDNNKMKRTWSFSFSWNDFMKPSNNFRRPSYYLPAAIVLILLFLVFFGRSFAILCTSIGWYIIPTLERSKPNPTVITRSTEKKKKKKEYARIYSDHKMIPPKTASKNHSGNLKKHGNH